ncbi:hypothetical protein E8M01_31295 [Phreatobacter stygius]|uniref:Phosphohydrolase n=2 Tax=Phreatobacter stygius TaxID=1940610 RepID=A0A4D7B8L7_9HYPH|nr:hypothetical protein E8M01_31295 [Phreatobacter stygius]
MLAGLYGAPDRFYRGMAHVKALLGLAEAHCAALADREAVEAAIWFHDAIYDSRRTDNEAKSADLARDRLKGACDPLRLDRIASMITATATHVPPDFAEPAARADAMLFLDMDLAILGAPPAVFDAYEQATRKEYGWVDDATWVLGRSRVLRGFLERARIFRTAAFHQAYEQQARANIALSLRRLAGGGQGDAP